MLWQKKDYNKQETDAFFHANVFLFFFSEIYQNIHLSFGITEARTKASAGFVS